mmetsp:Transcript_25347/g.40137  ORF Transcript_25347/g.40137 Transcript_25347/m.40137 type:complete len:243 (-) Transcript_25347:2646-3374(-)
MHHRLQLLRPLLAVEAPAGDGGTANPVEVVHDLLGQHALDQPIRVGGQHEVLGSIHVREVPDDLQEVVVLIGLGDGQAFGQLRGALGGRGGVLDALGVVPQPQHLVVEVPGQVRPQDADVRIAVHAAPVDGVLEQAIQRGPVRQVLGAVGHDDVRGAAQVRGAELVELDPALGDVVAALLQDGVEPRQDEQHLGRERAQVAEEVMGPQRVGLHHVILDAWGGLKCDLQRLGQEQRRELVVGL